MSEVLLFGETMLALRSTRVGRLALHDTMTLSTAGAESTVATGLARLGHEVQLVVHVGDDDAGRIVHSALRAEGVRVVGRAMTDRPTGLMMRHARTSDVTQVAYHRAGSAGSTLAPSDVLPLLTETASLVHTSGITPALSSSSRAATIESVVAARERGLLTSYDVNFRSRLTTAADASSVLAELIPHLDVLFCGEDELPVLAGAVGATFPDADSALGRSIVPELVIKRGADGAVSDIGGTICTGDLFRVTALDSVGAGDAFVSGYLSALLDGEDPASRLLRGATSGALCVAGDGDWENLPTRAELGLVHHASGTVDR